MRRKSKIDFSPEDIRKAAKRANLMAEAAQKVGPPPSPPERRVILMTKVGPPPSPPERRVILMTRADPAEAPGVEGPQTPDAEEAKSITREESPSTSTTRIPGRPRPRRNRH